MRTLQNQPKAILQIFHYGWVICSAPGQIGIPIQTFSEIATRLGNPKKALVLDSGIGHHYKVTTIPETIFAIGEKEDLKKWREEIEKEIEKLSPLQRWWEGLHVGTSSATIFGVLAPEENPYKKQAQSHGTGSTPRDSSDFSRCIKLLELFPNWETRLAEVAEQFPETKWPKIVEKWKKLKSCTTKEQSEILSQL